MDREIREPLELLDEIEDVLKIKCVPITWPLGTGRDFAGVYNLLEEKFYVYKAGFGSVITDIEVRDGYDHADLREKSESWLGLRLKNRWNWYKWRMSH